MKSTQKGNRPSPILMAAPTLLVLIGFYAFFFQETRRQLNARRGELRSLESGQADVTSQLRSLRSEIDSLATERVDLEQRRARLASLQETLKQRQSSLHDQVISASGQTETMNRLTSMVLDRGLAIVGNESLASLDRLIEEENQAMVQKLELISAAKSRMKAGAAGPDEGDLSLRQALPATGFVVVPSAAEASDRSVGAKRQHEVTVQGSFAQVKDTIERISDDFPDVTITSVELEQVDLRSDVRNWTLSVLL